MKSRSRVLAALLGVALFGLVACWDPSGPEDRSKEDADDPKAEQALVAPSQRSAVV